MAKENYQTLDIREGFCVRVDDRLWDYKLSDDERKQVDGIWEEALDKNPGLFNGKLLHFIEVDSHRNEVIGQFVDYMYYFAQIRAPSLRKKIAVHPIAISCVCRRKDCVLIGKRSSTVTDFPAYYELVPSGGIDPRYVFEGKVNLFEAAAAELFEETGISKNQILNCKPQSIIQDNLSGIYEIVLSLQVNDEAKECVSEEYSELQWITKKELQVSLEEKRNKFVPLSLYILAQWGEL